MEDKPTMKKYVEIASKMRITGDFRIDIKSIDKDELDLIYTLATNDAIYNYCESIQDIDVRKLLIGMKLLDTKDQYDELLKQFRDCD